MNLYLTSVFSQTALSFVDNFKLVTSKTKVAFIANAADLYKDPWWIKGDRDKLVELGFIVKDIDLRTTQGEILESELKNSDVIFVAGGNTEYLLELSNSSGFFDIVKKDLNDKIYVGSSAGSVLAGPTVEPYYEESKQELKDLGYDLNLSNMDALHLTDIIIIPHVTKPKYKERAERMISQYKDKYPKMIMLSDNEAIAVIDNKSKTISV